MSHDHLHTATCTHTHHHSCSPPLQDLTLPPRHVEVNVHPTKREVGFLHSEELVEAVRAAVEQRLLAANSSRSFSQAAPAAQMRATVASLAAAPAAGAASQQDGRSSQRPAAQPYRVGAGCVVAGTVLLSLPVAAAQGSGQELLCGAGTEM
jgi:DNA mismatch repair ATPase MutL